MLRNYTSLDVNFSTNWSGVFNLLKFDHMLKKKKKKKNLAMAACC